MSEEGYKQTSDENKVNGESTKIANDTCVETCTTEGKKRSFDEAEASPASNSNTEEQATTTTSTDAATSTASTATEHKRTRNEETSPAVKGMTDICAITNLKVGDRIEVHWDVESPETGKTTRWWGATLVEHDGRVHKLNDEQNQDSVTVPLRVLLYDSYPEGGYPDESTADVAFVSDHLVFDLGIGATCCWRKYGDSWEPSQTDLTEATSAEAASSSANNNWAGNVFFDGSRESMTTIIDSVIARAFIGVNQQYSKLTAAQQRMVASSVGEAKVKFVDQMMVECSETKVITPAHVKRCMEVVKQELDEVKANRGY